MKIDNYNYIEQDALEDINLSLYYRIIQIDDFVEVQNYYITTYEVINDDDNLIISIYTKILSSLNKLVNNLIKSINSLDYIYNILSIHNMIGRVRLRL